MQILTHIHIYMLGIRGISVERRVVRSKLSQNGQRIAAFLRGEGAMRGPWRVAGPVGPQCVREHVGPMACSRPGSWEVKYIAPPLQK